MAILISKADYARYHGVKPATVSNWIANGKLTAPGLRSDGKIDRDAADLMIGRRVDPVRAASAAASYADSTYDQTEGGRPAPAWSQRDRAGTALLQARALSAGVDAERKRRELNSERGKYMLAEDAERAWAKILTGFLVDCETTLPDLARSLNLDRAGQVLLRKWWRDRRQRAAEQHAADAATYPDFVEDAAA